MRMRSRLLVMEVLFVLLWNSGFIGAEFGLPFAGPFTLLFWRYLALAVVLAVLCRVQTGTLRSVPWRRVSRAWLIGVLAHGVWLTCVLVALDLRVPAGIVALVTALQPLATGALSGAVVGERTTPHQWVGLIVGFAGVAVAVGTRAAVVPGVWWPAYLVPFGSVIGITAASLLQRRLALESASVPRLPVLEDQLHQCAATAVALLPGALLIEGMAADWTPTFMATMVWLIFAVSLGAYGLMWCLLERRDATRVASLFYLSPPVTMLMAFAAFGDVPSCTDLVGMALAAAGVLIVHRGGRS
jgi:drug/metabolite transporter (DMT)-like permease